MKNSLRKERKYLAKGGEEEREGKLSEEPTWNIFGSTKDKNNYLKTPCCPSDNL